MEFVGLLALLVFAARLAGRSRAVDRPDGWAAAAVVSLAALSAAVKVASFGPGLVGRQHYERYDAETVTAMFDLNEAAYDLSWALDGCFLLLLGAAALALRRHAALAGRLGAGRRRSHRGRNRRARPVRQPPTGVPAVAGRREHLVAAHPDSDDSQERVKRRGW